MLIFNAIDALHFYCLCTGTPQLTIDFNPSGKNRIEMQVAVRTVETHEHK